MAYKKPEGRKYSILGIVFAVLSLVVLPIVFGPLAVIFGIIAVLKDDIKLGITAIVLGVVLFSLITANISAFLVSKNKKEQDTGLIDRLDNIQNKLDKLERDLSDSNYHPKDG